MLSDNEHQKQMNNLTPNTMKTPLFDRIWITLMIICLIITILVTL